MDRSPRGRKHVRGSRRRRAASRRPAAACCGEGRGRDASVGRFRTSWRSWGDPVRHWSCDLTAAAKSVNGKIDGLEENRFVGASMIRRLALAVFAAVAALALNAAGPAQAYPDRPVRIVVPFPAGGSNDVIARLMAQKLGAVWGKSVIVENRPGAGGNVGSEYVARSSPDGY